MECVHSGLDKTVDQHQNFAWLPKSAVETSHWISTTWILYISILPPESGTNSMHRQRKTISSLFTTYMHSDTSTRRRTIRGSRLRRIQLEWKTITHNPLACLQMFHRAPYWVHSYSQCWYYTFEVCVKVGAQKWHSIMQQSQSPKQ